MEWSSAFFLLPATQIRAAACFTLHDVARKFSNTRGTNMRYITPRITSTLNAAAVVLGGKVPGNYDGVEGLSNAAAYEAAE